MGRTSFSRGGLNTIYQGKRQGRGHKETALMVDCAQRVNSSTSEKQKKEKTTRKKDLRPQPREKEKPLRSTKEEVMH